MRRIYTFDYALQSKPSAFIRNFLSLQTFIVLVLLLFAGNGWGQVSGDYRSKTTGNWDVAANWETFDGTVWADASNKPVATNSVYLQSGHTMTLTVNEACNDLHFCNNATSSTSGTVRGKVDVAAFTLEVSGKFRSYWGAVGVVPGTATSNVTNQPYSSSGGKIKFVGNTRNIVSIGEWAAINNSPASNDCDIEIALSPGQVGTFQTNFKAGNWTFTSGTMNILTVAPDKNTTLANVTIGANATVVSSTVSNTFQKSSNAVAGALIVDGTLVFTGATPRVQMTSVTFNGTVKYDLSTSQMLVTKGTGTVPGADPNVYSNLIFSNAGAKRLGLNTTVNGTLTVAGTGIFSLNGFSLTYGSSSTVEYAGSSAQTTNSTELPSSGGPNSLTVNNSNGVTLGGNVNIAGNLTLTNGLLKLGGNDLTLGTLATIAGTPSSTSMVVATGAGQLRKAFAAAGNFLFPVGDNTVTAEYSPVTLNFASGTFETGNYAGVNLVNAKYPDDPNIGSYLNRYWNIAQSGITDFSCNATFQYLVGDISGTESLIYCVKANVVPFIAYNLANTTDHQLTANGLTSFSTFTGTQIPIIPTAFNVTGGGQHCGNTPGLPVGLDNSETGVAYTLFHDGFPQEPIVAGTGAAISFGDQYGTWTFTVTGHNGAGTTPMTGNAIIIVNPLPYTPDDIVGPSTVVPEQTGVVFSVNAIPYATGYTWTLPAGASITAGANTRSITVSFSASAVSGIITVAGTNACGIGFSSEFNLTVQPSVPLTLNFTSTDVSCAGSFDGSITTTVIGGTAPYTYAWNNGATTTYLNGLFVGQYSLTVTDAMSGTISHNWIIMQPTPIFYSATTINVTCSGGYNGSISSTTTGGVPPYSYSWSTGDTTRNLSNLAAGTYNVMITDANGCTLMQMRQITEPTPILYSVTTKNVSCFGASDGSITGTTSGGTPPYTYLWGDGSRTESISNLPVGSYSCQVSDANNCSGFAGTMVTGPTEIMFFATVIPASCPTGNEGSIQNIVFGGTPGYIFLWSNGASTESISDLTPGEYSLTVTDSHSCLRTAVWNVGQASDVCADISVVGEVANTVCYNATNIITVAETAPFIVQSTGIVEMIAGVAIIYKPGTKVMNQGYMLGRISAHYCGGNVQSFIAVATDVPEVPTISGQSFFKVYPNPTTGVFTLEFTQDQPLENVKVEVYGMQGEKVLNTLVQGERKHTFSLEGKPTGIYFIRVSSRDKLGSQKIIKK